MMSLVYQMFLLLLLLSLAENLYGQTLCLQGEVRLNNTGVFATGQGAGRVEICRCATNSSCSWQTVSTGSLTVPFSWKNSIVVCRELKYFDVQSPVLQNTVPSSSIAPESVDIFSTTFLCDGTESSLSSCATGSGTGGQTHRSDAYVACQSSTIVNKVRLVGSTTPGQGVVEIYQAELLDWVTICPVYWTDGLATILCTSLGYLSGSARTYSGPFKGSEINTNPSISYVSCPYYSTFSPCTFVQSGSCKDSSSLAGAVCLSDNSVAEGSIQLGVYYISNEYDRVEVYFNGRWGTVCGILWDSLNGEVACRQLGREFNSVPDVPVTFNSLSSRPIYIRQYNCLGTEPNLTLCPMSSLFPVGFVSTDCTHANDAWLDCEDFPNSGGTNVPFSTRVIFGTIIIIGLLIFGFFFCKYRLMKPMISCCDKIRSCIACLTMQSQPRRTSSSSSSSSSSIDSNLNTRNTGSSVNWELNKIAPPSYKDALKLNHVQPPPEYGEVKDSPPLPYPIISDFNPAHPPHQSTPDYPPIASPIESEELSLVTGDTNIDSTGPSQLDSDPPYPD